MTSWQDIVVLAVVLAALAWVVNHLRDSIRGQGGGTCSGCSGCAGGDRSQDLVNLQDMPPRRPSVPLDERNP